MPDSFPEIVSNQLSDLIEKYCLEVTALSESQVLLRHCLYSIVVYAERDRVEMIYIASEDSKQAGPNIFEYLITKRRHLLSFSLPSTTGSYSDFLRNRVASLAGHLRAAGRDILEGDKEWLKGYSWAPIPTADLLRQAPGSG